MTSMPYPAKSILAVLALAIALFVPLFLTQGVGAFDFWWWMTTNILLLLTVVQFVDSQWRHDLLADLLEHPGRKIVLGILSAIILYAVFWFGNQATRILFAGAAREISAVYAFKQQAPALRIVLLMVFIIGPGEELFWRGFLQRRFEDTMGGWTAWLAATAVYTAVHLASGNPILVLAAGVCGLFWGWLYWKRRSLLLNVVSHTLWDITVFLLLPLN